MNEAEIQFEAPAQTADGTPLYHPGETVSGTVLYTPDKDQHARGIQLWIGCHIHGSGSSEDFDVVPEHFIHEGDLSGGQLLTFRFEGRLPSDAPASYQGRRIKFDWLVRLRVDIPVLPDHRTEVPFVVKPQRLEA